MQKKESLGYRSTVQRTSKSLPGSLVQDIIYTNQAEHRMSSGLERAREQLQNINSLSKYVILITASDPKEDSQAVRNMKTRLEQNGVQIFTVGVGNTVTLQSMSQLSTNNNVFMSDSYDDLIGNVVKIRELLCQKARKSK